MIGAFAKLMQVKQLCCHKKLLRRRINLENWDIFKNSIKDFVNNKSDNYIDKLINEIQQQIISGICIICYNSMDNCALMAKCGHIFCCWCMGKIHKSNGLCPTCRFNWKL